MGAFFKICYAVWIGILTIMLIVMRQVSHNPQSFFKDFCGFLALVIAPYLYFLFIFKIPVDFALWCTENRHNPNNFRRFFRHNLAWFVCSVALPVPLMILFEIEIALLVCVPFAWLYVILLKQMLCLAIRKIRKKF